MENTIAIQNSHRLASLSIAFCAINGLEVTPELVPILSNAVLSGCARWCAENGQEFNPREILIPDDALAYAFGRCHGRCQEIAILANIAAQTGIGMEGLTD